MNESTKEPPADEEDDTKPTPLPEIGSVIYLPSRIYFDHGVDDFCGGKATVLEVRFVGTRRRASPHIVLTREDTAWHNWENELFLRQEGLRIHFADSPPAHQKPDFSIDANPSLSALRLHIMQEAFSRGDLDWRNKTE